MHNSASLREIHQQVHLIDTEVAGSERSHESDQLLRRRGTERKANRPSQLIARPGAVQSEELLQRRSFQMIVLELIELLFRENHHTLDERNIRHCELQISGWRQGDSKSLVGVLQKTGCDLVVIETRALQLRCCRVRFASSRTSDHTIDQPLQRHPLCHRRKSAVAGRG